MAAPLVIEVVQRFEVRADAGATVTLTALVPSTVPGRQEVLAQSFSTPPSRVWTVGESTYAELALPAGAELEVRTRLLPADTDLASRRRSQQPLSPEERALDTLPERFLETDDAAVRALAPGARSADPVRATFRAVLDALAPTPFHGDSWGALGALERGGGDCTEYADLLVAALRSEGLPAREVEGYVAGYHTTPLHDWAEVWLEGRGWVTLDPLYAEGHPRRYAHLPPRYVRLSVRRHDDVLGGYHYYAFTSAGGEASVIPRVDVATAAR